MRPASAKAKGRRFQQLIALDLLDAFPSLLEDDVTSRSMGASGTDLLLSPAAQRVFPYAVEVKCVERVNVWEAWAQSEANAGDLVPLLVVRRNHTAPLAVVSWSEFLWLTQRARSV